MHSVKIYTQFCSETTFVANFYHFQVWNFFASNGGCVKKWKISRMLKIYNPPIWNIYHPILTLTEMSLTVQLWFHQSVQTHDTIFSLLPFATTPVKSRSTQIKPSNKRTTCVLKFRKYTMCMDLMKCCSCSENTAMRLFPSSAYHETSWDWDTCGDCF